MSSAAVTPKTEFRRPLVEMSGSRIRQQQHDQLVVVGHVWIGEHDERDCQVRALNIAQHKKGQQSQRSRPKALQVAHTDPTTKVMSNGVTWNQRARIRKALSQSVE